MTARPFRRAPWPLLALALSVLPSLVAHAGSPPRPERAPSITLRTARGPVALDSLRGKVVLVDFWASWCAPCARSFPWLDAMQKQYGDSGLVVLAVTVDKSSDAADRFLAEHPSTLLVGYDPAGEAASAFGVQGMPSTFLVGRDGVVRLRHVGFDPRGTGPLERGIREACGS